MYNRISAIHLFISLYIKVRKKSEKDGVLPAIPFNHAEPEPNKDSRKLSNNCLMIWLLIGIILFLRIILYNEGYKS
jgi:hypothetical protein